jgi:hypothetical protein
LEANGVINSFNTLNDSTKQDLFSSIKEPEQHLRFDDAVGRHTATHLRFASMNYDLPEAPSADEPQAADAA